MPKKNEPTPIGFRYVLHHACHKPGCEGSAGMEVLLTPELAEWFDQHVVPANGATLIGPVYRGSADKEKATNDPADNATVENRKADQ